MLIEVVDGFPLGFGGGLARGFPALERTFAPVAGGFIPTQRRADELTMSQVTCLRRGANFEIGNERAHVIFYHEEMLNNINKSQT
jgi:hypothetical protein